MQDKIYIKTINSELTWNIPIYELINLTCYNVDFLNSKIDVFLSRGEIIDGMEFMRAQIGTYNICDINNSYFNKITFELISPDIINVNRIQTTFGTCTKIELDGNLLVVYYIGDNELIPNHSVFIKRNNLDLNDINNWHHDISEIRTSLKSEYRFFSYDYYYKLFYNYGWLEFDKVNILGLQDLNFRAHFNYNSDNFGITHIESILGNALSDYDRVKKILDNKIGIAKSEKDSFDQTLNLHFTDTTWQTEDFEVRLHSALIPRAEPFQLRYELEIKKYST